MSQTSLTSRYRPQTFAQVTGQTALKKILSRAAQQDRVAPAYLFSGTRGVGKTTLARIFAKALNCQNSPTPEPCNKCSHCLQITDGAAVDVTEMDGASSRKIDDIRRLKDDIGFSPMQCRYKVFIIDEAHMLTREAFNALLKTLEEPPGFVTFILATTEPEKFPQTIVSRCQHFVFKRLTQKEIHDHLKFITEQEKLSASPQALALIARRAAGSVRDGMSLLAQVMALADSAIDEELVRDVLGIAGHEVIFNMLEAISRGGLKDVAAGLEDVLSKGLDIGFFLRELIQAWRNMFLIARFNQESASLIDLTAEEMQRLTSISGLFTPAHTYAAWQMTEQGQRQILTSPEPAQSLELLLFNLAMIPELMPVGQIDSRLPGNCKPAVNRDEGSRIANVQEPVSKFEGTPKTDTEPASSPEKLDQTPSQNSNPSLSWEGFTKNFASRSKGPQLNALLKRAKGEWKLNCLHIICSSSLEAGNLNQDTNFRLIEETAKSMAGSKATVTISCPDQIKIPDRDELRKMAKADPLISKALSSFDASILDVRVKKQSK